MNTAVTSAHAVESPRSAPIASSDEESKRVRPVRSPEALVEETPEVDDLYDNVACTD
jgi:hypothetical protein